MTAACPACTVGEMAVDETLRTIPAQGQQDLILSVPDMHCAGCIRGVERTLLAQPGVTDARVNLSLKRARVTVNPGVTAAPLIKALSGAGFKAAELDPLQMQNPADDAGRAILLRIAIAGFAMMNVMILSVAVWSGATDATRGMFHWISAAIALPAAMFCAQPFFENAWSALRARSLNMDVPISLAILLASGMSLFETISGGAEAYFDAALSLTFFLLVGRYLDYRTRRAARSAAQEIAALEVPRVLKIINGEQVETHLQDVEINDTLFLPTGSRLPVDGVITSGQSLMDRSILTGESDPVAAATGAALSAGEINISGPIELRATAVGEDTSLRRIAKLIELAESSRTAYTGLADKAARIYAPLVHLLSFAAFVGWFLATNDVRLSLNIAVAVLIITCPCALGLAVPAVMTAANSRLFRQGVLVKNETALERLAQIDQVVFDKTGTLTTGRAHINRDDFTATELSALKALAMASTHPVSIAINAALPDVTPAPLTDISEVAGQGVNAKINGQTARLGKGDWAGDAQSPAFQLGQTPAKSIALSETLAAGVVEAVKRFQDAGLTVSILSGDTPAKVQSIATELGITDYRAAMSPQDKQAYLQSRIANGAKPLMVGDGLNDTGALAQAHVSIAPASALDASRTAADLVLLNSSFAVLPDMLQTAKDARRRILENFSLAVIYNAIAIPIALAGLASPLLAALAMSASSISVCLNALRLR